ncbi:MAG: LLM class flavin-dependent oxidoreductase [Thermomicrobiales bacterium]
MSTAVGATDRPPRRLKVGLFLPVGEQMMAGETPHWTDLLAMARLAEDVGFDSLWLADHLLMQFPFGTIGAWECWSLLAALAASTQRVELGPLVSCTGYRNPALLAKMADTVDEISGGRLILGGGAGWAELEHRAYGYPFDHRASRFEEAIQIICGLLREGRMDFAGRYYQARECELRPRGPRAQGPPILIGTARPRMLWLAARYADCWNAEWKTLGQLPELCGAVDVVCADVGRDPTTLVRTAAVRIDLPNAQRRGFGMAHASNSGNPEEIAAILRGYAAAGITHIQAWINPNTPTGIEAFAPILNLLD